MSASRSVRSSTRSRALTAVGVVALAAAGVLGAIALFDSDSPKPVLTVQAAPDPDTTTTSSSQAPARLTRSPASAAPATAPAVSSVAESTATLVDTPPPVTAAPPSVGATTAPTTTTIPQPPPDSPPVRLRSSRIAVAEFPIRPVGLQDDGKLEVPDETEIGWYELGATPGAPGVSVLAAHVTWNRQLGPFAFIGDLRPGDVLDVETRDGIRREYTVTELQMYPKGDISTVDIWRDVGPERLALITCGGTFDDERNRFSDNIVVIAEPVGA